MRICSNRDGELTGIREKTAPVRAAIKARGRREGARGRLYANQVSTKLGFSGCAPMPAKLSIL